MPYFRQQLITVEYFHEFSSLIGVAYYISLYPPDRSNLSDVNRHFDGYRKQSIVDSVTKGLSFQVCPFWQVDRSLIGLSQCDKTRNKSFTSAWLAKRVTLVHFSTLFPPTVRFLTSRVARTAPDLFFNTVEKSSFFFYFFPNG